MNEYSLFNQAPSLEVQDIHRSWILAMPNGELIEKLRKTPRAQKPLSEFIKQYTYLEEETVINDVNKTIQQTSPDKLKELILKLGVTLLSNIICQTITKKDVIEIKGSLGEDLYNFSIKQAPTICGTVGRPDFIKYHFDSSIPPLNTVICLGYKSLRQALGNIDNACIYKLPKEWDINYTNNIEEATPEDISFYKRLISVISADDP